MKVLSPSIPILKWFILFLFISIKAFAEDSSILSGCLPNGLTYFIHPNPHSKKHISLDFIVRVGSLNELENERGFSHLIEHLVANEMSFKGIKVNDELCPLWDLSDPNISELTSYKFTEYHMDVSLGITDGLEEGLKSLSSILSALPSSHQGFIESKEDILEEITEIYNSSTKNWQHERISYEYPPYQYKHPIGDPYCISQASSEKVYDFFRRWYQPNQAAIIVVGNINPSLVESLIIRYFQALPGSPYIEHSLEADTLDPIKCFVYFDHELDQIELSLTKALPHMPEKESLLFSMWTHLLQNHLQTNLSFYSPRLEILSYPHLLRLKVFFPKESYQNGALQLQDALESFYVMSIDPQQFNALKTQMKHATLSQLQNNQYLSEFYRDLFVTQDANLQLPSEHSFDAIDLESYCQAAKTFYKLLQASTQDLGNSHDH